MGGRVVGRRDVEGRGKNSIKEQSLAQCKREMLGFRHNEIQLPVVRKEGDDDSESAPGGHHLWQHDHYS